MAGNRFLLDESVVKGALQRAGACGEAIVAIVRRCDSLVFNEEWMRTCYVEVKRSAHTLSGYVLLRVLDYSFAHTGKMCQELGMPPSLPDESGIHHKDIWLVRLAVASGAHLVTEDRALADALSRINVLHSDAQRIL